MSYFPVMRIIAPRSCGPSGKFDCALRSLPNQPSARLWIFQVQKSRNPLRCQAIAVAGLTMSSAERQSPQTRERKTQNRRSAAVSFSRFLAERLTESDVLQLQSSARAEHRTQHREDSGQQDQHRIKAIFSNRTEFPIGTVPRRELTTRGYRGRFAGRPGSAWFRRVTLRSCAPTCGTRAGRLSHSPCRRLP